MIPDVLQEAIIKYILEISQHNVKPHLDIERSIGVKQNGIFTFNLRVNRGNIEDYVQFETVTYASYQSVIFTSIEECTIASSSGNGSPEDAVRPVDSQRDTSERHSPDGNAQHRQKQTDTLLTR